MSVVWNFSYPCLVLVILQPFIFESALSHSEILLFNVTKFTAKTFKTTMLCERTEVSDERTEVSSLPTEMY